ncbi:hypothetical protein [Corynebacterium macclintockiae]|uniref:hypothetical protein n=1 Tax=Corynebacterium macclintockiae TaxID=2913501 RepID=UPI003EBC578A
MHTISPSYWATRAIVEYQAQNPGSDLRPTAPPGVGQKVDTFLNWAFYICMAAALVGVMVMLAGIVMSRRDGHSDEVTSNAFRVGVGTAALAGVGGLFSWLMGGGN